MKESFSAAWRDYKLLLGVGTLYAILCCAQVLALGVKFFGLLKWMMGGLLIVLTLGAGFVGAFFLGALFIELLRMKPAIEGGFAASLREVCIRMIAWTKSYVKKPVFASGCLGLIVSYHTAFFIFQKSTVRFYHPYAWDQRLVAVEKFLHFGRLPHTLLYPFLQGGNFDLFLQTIYFSWFFVMYMVLGSALFYDQNRQRRMTFIWVFGLSWYCLGGLGATYFSTAGPYYYHIYYPNLANPYADMLQYMQARQATLSGILTIHKQMVEWNTSSNIVVPNGIAAMPSMHGAIAWLIFLYARPMGRWLAGMALAFFVFVYIACVYFGLHYAFDIYFSVGAVSLLWWAAGRHVKYHLSREPA